ncbi:hypothetical protein evm_011257 [Chilo suppressalis]|nr:hypothetical protein evm_011257 [Chilo suppressalis]
METKMEGVHGIYTTPVNSRLKDNQVITLRKNRHTGSRSIVYLLRSFSPSGRPMVEWKRGHKIIQHVGTFAKRSCFI